MLYNFLQCDAWDFAYATRDEFAQIARTLEVNADTQQKRMDQVCEQFIFEKPLTRRRALNKFTQITSSQEEKDHLEEVYQQISADEDLQKIFRESLPNIF